MNENWIQCSDYKEGIYERLWHFWIFKQLYYICHYCKEFPRYIIADIYVYVQLLYEIYYMQY